MTSTLHGRLGRLLSTRLPLLMLPLLVLAACATPGGPTALTPPAQIAMTGSAAPDATTPAPRPATSAAPADAFTDTDTDAEAATAPVPVDPLRPEVRLDLDDRAAQTDLWARVRRGFTMPDLDSDLVRDREQWYATRPDYVQRMTERGGRYLFHIVEELERRGMPTELALLPFIESAFNPQAMSSARASGMWQFMAATGRDF